MEDVANPAYDPLVLLAVNCQPDDRYCTTDPNAKVLKKFIQRDYGFGATNGTITLGGTPLTNVTWSDGLITATVPNGASTGQLMVKRGDNGKESVVGLTVHVGGPSPIRVNPNATPGSGAFKTIQAAMDSVPLNPTLLQIAAGTPLITVAPGTYNEYVIMDKRVRLQGWGANSVTINATKFDSATVATWRARINSKANNTFDLLPGQTLGIDPANNEPLAFGAEEGPGVLVVGRQGVLGGLLNECRLGSLQQLSIDGLTVTGSDSGGGILASGYACGLEVSNNRVVGNYGTYGGGIRVGHTVLAATQAGNLTYTDGVNRYPSIHHNWVSQNGATANGGGGGITMGTGSDGYKVSSNYVCGNFSMSDGGGLSHLGSLDWRARQQLDAGEPHCRQQVHLQPDVQPIGGSDGWRCVRRGPRSAGRFSEYHGHRGRGG